MTDAAQQSWYRTPDPEGRGHVFIITYGRSGSTLLMNLINSSPLCLIRGENNNALHGLFTSVRRIAEAQVGRETTSQPQTSPWWGISEVDIGAYQSALARDFVRSVIRPDARHRLCGFKEIRYSAEDVPDLPAYVRFLTEAFAPAKIVFNTRNLADVARSKWWSQNPDALEVLQAIEARFQQFTDPESFFHFRYDAALADQDHIRSLFEFLELPFEGPTIAAVLSQKHSY